MDITTESISEIEKKFWYVEIIEQNDKFIIKINEKINFGVELSKFDKIHMIDFVFFEIFDMKGFQKKEISKDKLEIHLFKW